MNETEPKYFIEFRKHIDNKFETIDKRFDDMDKKIDMKIDKTVGDLAISIKLQFEEQEQNLKEYMHENFASKLDLYETEVRIRDKFEILDERLEKIEGHIGRFEIRSQNLEQIVLKDYKPRIEALELAIAH